MQHGKKFEQRIREILRGQRFEPLPEQKKEKYNGGTLDYFLV
jgi:hypothetical protein